MGRASGPHHPMGPNPGAQNPFIQIGGEPRPRQSSPSLSGSQHAQASEKIPGRCQHRERPQGRPRARELPGDQGAVRAISQMHLYFAALLGRQISLAKGGESTPNPVAAHIVHSTNWGDNWNSGSGSSRFSSSLRSASRPRRILDFTVPNGN